MKLDHVALQVADMDRALEFYVGALGMKLISRQVNEAHREEYVFLELDGGRVELIRHIGGSLPARSLTPPYCPHLALTTEDMEASLSLIRERGLPLLAGPFEIAGEERWVYTHDPDHNVIEFMQWLRVDS